MSPDQATDASGSTGSAAGTPGGSDEDRASRQRAAYEAELNRITSADMMVQAVVSLLNIGARRLGPPEQGSGAGGEEQAGGTGEGDRPGEGGGGEPAEAQRDLEQVRDAIDGVRALLEILERRMPQELRPLRDALAQLQLAYAREARAGAGAERGGAERPDAGQAQPAEGAGAAKDEPSHQPGPAESSGRLWVPGR